MARSLINLKPQDAEWYEHVPGKNSRGERVLTPAYDKCCKCGVTAEAFPTRTWDQICDSYRSSSAFRDEFLAAKAALDDASRRTWKPATVGAGNTVGVRFEVKYLFVEASEFLRFYKLPHASVGLKTISGVVNEEGQFMEGVLIRDDPRHLPPPELCYRTCVLYSDIYNMVQEHVLDEKHQLRAAQHKELFEWVNSSTVQNRDASLRPAGRAACLHFKDLQAKVDEVQMARRAAAEQDASNGHEASLAPGSGGVPPRRGVQAPTIVPAPAREAKKAKGQGQGKGLGAARARGNPAVGAGKPPLKRLKPVPLENGAEVQGLGSASRPPEAGHRSEGSELQRDQELLSVPAVLAGGNVGRALVAVRGPGLQRLAAGRCFCPLLCPLQTVCPAALAAESDCGGSRQRPPAASSETQDELLLLLECWLLAASC